MNNSKSERKTKQFLKTYTYAIIVGVTILALSLTLALTVGDKDKDTALTVNTKTIEFASPVANGTVSKDYSASELQYNEVLKQWEIHKAIDFVGNTSTQVLSAYDGTVKNVYTDYLNGTVVEIEHTSGLKTIYKSLSSDVKVKIGDEVKKGTVIGSMSNTMSKETTTTPMLHFEVTLNGVTVDPNNYLNLSNK